MIVFPNFELPPLHESVEVTLSIGIAGFGQVVDVLAIDSAVDIGNVEYLYGGVS
jgi:hypothetical protein